ncbi:MAG: flavin reductase family protein [Candidatus Altarchaeaceae archaeon]
MKVEDFYKVIAPRPIGLISTIDKEGNPNAAPFSFIMPASTEPEILCFASAPERRTLKNIRETKEFIVNIPSEENLEKLWFCAKKYTGKNKIKDAGFTEENAKKVKVPRIKECIAWIECSLYLEKELGDHVLVFGKVLEVDAIEDSPLKALMHIGGNKFCIPGKILKI